MLHVFVEGDNDLAYIDNMLAASRVPHELVTITKSRDLGAGEGKQALLSRYRQLRADDALTQRHDHQGKGAYSVFFWMDKDFDDLERSLIRCPHVGYTRGYCVENDIYSEADLLKGIATAAKIPRGSIVARWTKAHEWRRSCAKEWEDWIALVLFLTTNKIHLTSIRLSQPPPWSPFFKRKAVKQLQSILTEARSATAMSKTEFKIAWTASQRRARETIETGRFDSVFCGKWYTLFVIRDLRQVHKIKKNSRDFEHTLVPCLVSTIKFTSRKYTALRRRIEHAAQLAA